MTQNTACDYAYALRSPFITLLDVLCRSRLVNSSIHAQGRILPSLGKHFEIEKERFTIGKKQTVNAAIILSINHPTKANTSLKSADLQTVLDGIGEI